MANHKVDKHQCRHCKLSSPHIQMLYVKGKPRGECKQCFRLITQQRRLKAGVFGNFYNNLNNLVALNCKFLASLPPGAYPLLDRTYKRSAGYFAMLEGYFYIHLWDKARLIERDLYGFSTWLSNQNLIIDPAPITLEDAQGAVVELGTIGLGMVPMSIQDLLCMYDRKLQEHAVKTLRAEIDREKKRQRGK